MITATQQQYSAENRKLYLAFDLGWTSWKLAFATCLADQPWIQTIAARDLQLLFSLIKAAKQKFGLPADAHVLSCYEAGRDGFWLHRLLQNHAVENVVIDPASIGGSRRGKRPKTDKIDARAQLEALITLQLGKKDACSVLRIPSEQDEDDRHLHRYLKTLQRDRTRSINRIRGYLAKEGIDLHPSEPEFSLLLAQTVRWDGSKLPSGICLRIRHESEAYLALSGKIQETSTQLRQTIRSQLEDTKVAKVHKLMQLRGVNYKSAWPLVMEVFGWRTFNNRREVAGYAGFGPVHNQSGQMHTDRGISKAGNKEVRRIMVELAWFWLRHQPQSELSLWFNRRFAAQGPRLRKVGIVAVARKLLIALWRYLEFDEVPAAAIFSIRDGVTTYYQRKVAA